MPESRHQPSKQVNSQTIKQANKQTTNLIGYYLFDSIVPRLEIAVFLFFSPLNLSQNNKASLEKKKEKINEAKMLATFAHKDFSTFDHDDDVISKAN